MATATLQQKTRQKATHETPQSQRSRRIGDTFGKRRDAYEALWPVEATRALSEGLLQAPSNVRAPLKNWVRQRLPEGATPQAVRSLLEEGRSLFH